MRDFGTILCALSALILGGCINNTPIGPFVADETVRLEIDGSTVFRFDENTCQLSYNETRCEFGASNDTMLDYFVLSLSGIPAHTGDKVTAAVTWSTEAGERHKENVTLEAKRIRGDVIWLCDDGRHTAAVVRVLE